MKRSFDSTATPQDRTPFLQALFASRREWYFADLHEITLLAIGWPDPLVLRWASTDHDVVFENQRYAGGVRISETDGEPGARVKRGQLRTTIGLEVDELEITVLLDGTDRLPPADGQAGTSPFSLSEAVWAGLFEGAQHTLRRLFMPSPPAYPIHVSDLDVSAGAVTLFAGQITETDLTRTRLVIKTKSQLERLSRPMPWRTFERNCPFTLYEPRTCGVDPAGTGPLGAFRAVATITDPPGVMTVFVSGPTQPLDFFNVGTLRFTGGAMAGLRRMIQLYDPTGRITLLNPLPRLPTIGDPVLLQAGCRKTKEEDCELKFGNFVDPGDHTKGLRFGGFPAVPPPDTAV